jgi:heptosyltransferase-1
MKILLIKLSSMGDIIHTFPAIIEAQQNTANLSIDWLVDDQFVDLVKLQQQAINNIFTIPLRRAKKNIVAGIFNIIKNYLPKLRQQQYDLVIDAQGLLKSATLAKLIKTKKIVGLDNKSAREPIASKFYHQKIPVGRELHAIYRTKKLFAAALGYNSVDKIEYNLIKNNFAPSKYLAVNNIQQYVVLLHGTTWESKKWPPEHWLKLSQLLNAKGMTVVMMTCNQQERQFVDKLLAENSKIIGLADLTISEVIAVLAHASAVVSVDTGLGHLAAALRLNVVGLYGATSSIRAGILGDNCINLQSKYHCSPCLARECLEYKNNQSTVKQPCFLEITPEMVVREMVGIG